MCGEWPGTMLCIGDADCWACQPGRFFRAGAHLTHSHSTGCAGAWPGMPVCLTGMLSTSLANTDGRRLVPPCPSFPSACRCWAGCPPGATWQLPSRCCCGTVCS
jgi:hypothetical protein